MESEALIFIPDISGYTKFVTETEAKHSQHIITELLEVIINSEKLKMNVSEIEGDAVLFYRKGNPPGLNDLFLQAKRMFLDFHTHLKIIQRDNVCQCGACRSAINLSLKFVSHFGYLQEVTIQNFSKIMGSDVVLAHRLLKNNVANSEYLLLTDKYLDTQTNNTTDLGKSVILEKHDEVIKDFEDITVQYINLSTVRNEIPDVSGLKNKPLNYNNPDASLFINAPIMFAHELLTDNDAKLEYVPGLKDIKNSHRINRINSSHTCVFDDLEIHFVTRGQDIKEKEISFEESVQASIGITFISDYKLKEEKEGTRISLKIFPGKPDRSVKFFRRIFNLILTYISISKIRKQGRKNLELFKAYCEKKAEERKAK